MTTVTMQFVEKDGKIFCRVTRTLEGTEKEKDQALLWSTIIGEAGRQCSSSFVQGETMDEIKKKLKQLEEVDFN